MLLIWAKFIVCLLVVLFAGTRLSKYGDIIAEKTGLGGVWIGLLLMATATSLPELFTGISAVALVGAPNLALGDAFGSNLFNLMIIALLDILHREGPLLTRVSSGQVLVGGLVMLLIAFATISIFLSLNIPGLHLGWVSMFTPLLVLLYLLSLRKTFLHEQSQQGQLVGQRDIPHYYKEISLRRAYTYYAIATVFVIVGAVWLAFVGNEITEVTGWGATFVGSLFLATVTSAPEVVVSVAALRLGARDMAVANMLGSNMFNMGIVLAGDDLFYRAGPLFAEASISHVFTGLIAILMTCVIIVGLTSPSRRKMLPGLSWYTIALIVLFILGFCILFIMG
ncbi:MAG: sodium:calcium antiporter [Dehalococcoidia bacterium]|nr:sodium:calcium antiporter [Dehalococcoidia bacterium]